MAVRGTSSRSGRTSEPARRFDLILRGGRVIDPAQGIDSVNDVAILDGKIARIAPRVEGRARKVADVRACVVTPGLIDTHAHVYEHVTGTFGMNPDLVGTRAGVTTVVDQGGAAALTLQGFRKFIVEPARTRVYTFVSNYLVGGLSGHRYVALYGPGGIDVGETVRAIEKNRDLIKGIKCHAELGGYSRWGLETLRLAKKASRETKVPVYIHLGRLWKEADGTDIDPDRIMAEVVPLLDPGDVLAHPFTRHAGAFVSREGKVHPLVFEALDRGVRIDIGRGGHMSFDTARLALDAGLRPFTIGADIHGYTITRADWHGEWTGDTAKRKRGQPARGIGGASVFSLVQVMNELLALGFPLPEVIRMATANAATMLGLEDEIGTLATGSAADVSVLRLEEGDWMLEDCLGVRISARQRLHPRYVLRAGAFENVDSPLLHS